MKPSNRNREEYRLVGRAFPKKDSMALLLGKPCYMDDFAPSDCLVIKLVRSRYANALVKNVSFDAAMKIPGMVAVYTYKDVPGIRFTTAGQDYPEPSPYDRLILDRHVRFVGDPVAMVVGESEAAVDAALKLIKVDYEVLKPVLNFKKALDSRSLVHPEDDWSMAFHTGDAKRNLIHTEEHIRGDVDKVMKECDISFERSFHTKAVNQCFLETMRAYCRIDEEGRLHCVSSTQIVFHTRRILARALGISEDLVRSEKLRIGGGFGAKQTVNNEIYAAFVTWTLKRPSKIIYTRKECMSAGSPRHEMEVTVRIGAMNDGTIRALDVYALSNGGAYGEHSTTTIGLVGHKTLPLYTKNTEAARFKGDVVYTNLQSSGAYRGFGATQGCFAVESTVNELAERLGMDPCLLREKNIVKEGMIMPDYFDEKLNACALDKCIKYCKERFDWENKYPVRDLGGGRYRAAGMAITMQGSGISGIDKGSCRIAKEPGGSYTMRIAAADMGTGCDTILSQIAAEVLECSLSDIKVIGADTDLSPYDSGSYASSTTYVTGMATGKAALMLREAILKGEKLSEDFFAGEESLVDVTVKVHGPFDYEVMCCSKTSPPPFMASMAELEVDTSTGKVDVIGYTSIVDCGVPVNPALARVQAEGGALQGLGMALFENITVDKTGRIAESSFLQYRVPTRADFGKLDIDFVYSFEPTAAFGVKSIGEVTINTAAPAVAHGVARIISAVTSKGPGPDTGIDPWIRTLPITPEKVLFALRGVHYE